MQAHPVEVAILAGRESSGLKSIVSFVEEIFAGPRHLFSSTGQEPLSGSPRLVEHPLTHSQNFDSNTQPTQDLPQNATSYSSAWSSHHVPNPLYLLEIGHLNLACGSLIVTQDPPVTPMSCKMNRSSPRQYDKDALEGSTRQTSGNIWKRKKHRKTTGAQQFRAIKSNQCGSPVSREAVPVEVMVKQRCRGGSFVSLSSEALGRVT